MRRLAVLPASGLLLLILLASCTDSRTRSQRPAPPHSVAVLQLGTHPVIDQVANGLNHRLRELYGDSIRLNYFNANFDMNTMAIMARQMVASPNEVLVSITTPASLSLYGANRGIKPMVFTFVSDPTALGYKGPGTLPNLAGLSDEVDYEAVLRLIRTVLPKVKRIGYLLTRSEPNAVVVQQGFQSECMRQGLDLRTVVIAEASDIRMAANTIVDQVDCFLFGGDNTIASSIETLLDVAKGHGRAVFACDEQTVDRGALAGMSVDYTRMGRETAETVSMILGGAGAAKMPVRVFRSDRLFLNTATAKALRITLSDSLVSHAAAIVD